MLYMLFIFTFYLPNLGWSTSRSYEAIDAAQFSVTAISKSVEHVTLVRYTQSNLPHIICGGAIVGGLKLSLLRRRRWFQLAWDKDDLTSVRIITVFWTVTSLCSYSRIITDKHKHRLRLQTWRSRCFYRNWWNWNIQVPTCIWWASSTLIHQGS